LASRPTARRLGTWAFAVPLAFAGAAAVGAGCASTDTTFNDGSKAPDPNDIAAPGSPNTIAATDGGAASATRGSPLCNASSNTCLPDDDGYGKSLYGMSGTTVSGCVAHVDTTDAGPAAAVVDASTTVSACRVNATGVPQCLEGDRLGVDGVTCTTGSDCAPGYDCITGEKVGVCRHYCCSGSCVDHTSKNGGPTFCDIQKLLEDELTVPVCMPIKKCRLLVSADCNDQETCGVVTETGDTGCVAVGTAQAGDSCDNDHCAAGLTCLGNPGDRRCYTLCRTDGDQCTGGQTCTTVTLFQDPTYGVCKTASH
jgi:hypothetical protein